MLEYLHARRLHTAALTRHVLAIAAALTVCASPASAAAPAPFATASANCTSGTSDDYTTGPIAQPREHYMKRLMATGFGELGWSGGKWVSGPDTVWESGDGLDAGDPLTGYLSCDEDSSYSGLLTFFDTPTAPTSFTGATTFISSFFSTTRSDLRFTAPGTAQYVADLTLGQGAVEMSGGTFRQSFASSGTYQLGTLDKGLNGVSVDALEGPQAQWTVAIRALPVAVTGPSFGTSFARPGDILTAEYRTSGDTQVTAVIVGPSGQVARQLAAAFPIDAGDHTFTWDGLSTSGAPLPDGIYTLNLGTKDPSGYQASAATQVTLDGTPPSVSRVSPAAIPKRNAFVVNVSDSSSGVEYAALTIGGYTVAELGSRPDPYSYLDEEQATTNRGISSGRLSYRPKVGWKAGSTYRWKVEAMDATGNQRTVSGTFAIRKSAKPSKTRRCRAITLTPRSDNALTRIRARGINCKAARARLRTWAKSNYRPRKGPRGFRCKVAHRYIANERLSCRKGKGRELKVISFITPL